MKSFIKRMNQGLLYSNFLWFKIFHPVGKFVKTQDVLKGVKRLYPVEKLIKPGGGEQLKRVRKFCETDQIQSAPSCPNFYTQ